MRSWITILGSFFAGVVSTVAVVLLIRSMQAPKIESVPVDASAYAGRAAFRGEGAGPGPRLQIRELNMNSDPLASTLPLVNSLSLNAEQKQKVQAVSTAFKTTYAKWQKDNETELNKLREEFRAAAQSASPEKIRELMQKRQDIQATAPKADDAIAQIKAILTPDQLKTFEQRLATRQTQPDVMRRLVEDRVTTPNRERPTTQPVRTQRNVQARAGV